MRVRTSVLTILLCTGLTVPPASAVGRAADDPDPDPGLRLDNRFTRAELQAKAEAQVSA